MTEELVEILDEDGKFTDDVKPKKAAHKYGYWHQASQIWIYNSKGEILLQKRAKDKDSYPGLWDISVAGHVSAHETPENAALREMREEIGVELKTNELKKIDVRKDSLKIPELDWNNNEFVHVFLWRFNGNINKLKLLDGEVESLKFISLGKLESEISDPYLSKNYVPHGRYYFDVIKAIRNELNK